MSEAEFFTTSKDACPNLRSMFENYSSGYFKVPSVGAGTANTEFEVLTGMNLRYFGPGEYPYKTYVKEKPCESAASALSALAMERMRFITTAEISTAGPEYLTTWDSTALPARNS